MGEPRRFHEEHPIEDAERLGRLADEVIEWIAGNPRTGAVVIGILGGRGSGKTSLLRTVGSRMLRDGRKRFVVPTRDREQLALIEPDRLDDARDDLLFQLFDHLDPWPHPNAEAEPGAPDPLKEARRLATRRADPAAFNEIARESASSTKALPDRLVAEHATLAASLRLLSASLKAYLGGLGVGGGDKKRLVLLIDDLDLQPQRALEFLDLVPRVLEHPGVVVVLAGDEALLVSAIQRSLAKEGRDGPLLGRAYFDKRVPVTWRLDPWEPEDRFEFVWPADGAGPGRRAVEPIVPRYWRDEANEALTASSRRFGGGEPTESPGRSVRDHARELLSEMLPGSPRALKAFDNRLAMEWGEPSERRLDVVRGRLRRAFQIPDIVLDPFRTLVVATEASFPILRLDWALIEIPRELGEGLRAFARFEEPEADRGRAAESVAEQGDRQRLAGEEQAELRAAQDVLLARLGVDPSLAVAEVLRARSALERLARAWARLTTLAAVEANLRFLAISVDGDARQAFEGAWRLRVQEPAVVDLRLRTDDRLGRPAPKDLAACLADEGIRQRVDKLAQSRDRTWVGARAPLSALVWLGWRMRYARMEVAFNDARGAPERYPLPEAVLTFRRAGTSELIEVAEPRPVDGGGSDAVVLLDLIGKATAAQLDLFRGAPEGARRILVRRTEPGVLQPSDLRPLLEDVIEVLGGLREGGITTFHLGLLAPDVFALALGRQLHAQGRVIVYEWEGSEGPYVPVATLEGEVTPVDDGGVLSRRQED